MPGEIAEMMLEGLMCEQCGEYMGDDDGEGQGFPGLCGACEAANKRPVCQPVKKPKKKRRR